jgi:tetratricopeptide (TPR) repeat protein
VSGIAAAKAAGQIPKVTGRVPHTTADAMTAAAMSASLCARVEAVRLKIRRHFRPVGAEKILTQILEAATEAGDVIAQAAVYLELAAVGRYQHDLTRAHLHAIRAWELYGRLGNYPGQAAAHLALAKIYLDGGHPTDLQLQHAALAVYSHEMQARIHFVRAQAALRQGAFKEAARLLHAAITLVEGCEEWTYYQARFRAVLGLVEALQGASGAEAHLQAAFQLAEAGGFSRIQAYCQLDLAQIALKRDDLGGAQQALKAAAACFVDIEDDLGRAHALSALGELWRRQGLLPRAIEVLEQARDLCTAQGHGPGETLAHRRLAEAYIDYLHEWEAIGQPQPQSVYARAAAELEVAVRQFEQLGARNGESAPLAFREQLLYLTEGAAACKPVDEMELRGQLHERFPVARLGQGTAEPPPVAPSAADRMANSGEPGARNERMGGRG